MNVMDSKLYAKIKCDSNVVIDYRSIRRCEDDVSPIEQKPKRQKSIYKGVFRCGNKFKAQIQTNGVQHYLGLFDDEKDAARAYDNHARVVLGTRAKTNLDYDVSELPDPFTVPPPPPPTPAAHQDDTLPDPNLEKAMPKRIYVGIKARQKRQHVTDKDDTCDGATNGKNGSSSGATKSFCEAIAESVGGILRDSSGNRIKRVNDGSISGIGLLLDGDNSDRTADGISDEGDDDLEPDWRDQIYYWTGLLSFDSLSSCLLWKGSWLGSFSGKPNPDEFSWSSNAFEYNGEVINFDDMYVHGLLRPRSGRFKGYYMMDNDGSGSLEKYLDNEYYVEFEEVRGLHPPRYTVVGKGDSNFGTFVLTGTYNAGNRVLEMARQYISEEDERCAMNVNQLKMHLIAAAAAMS